MGNSCLNCVNRVEAKLVSQQIGKSVGASICQARHEIVGLSTLSPKAMKVLADTKGEKCPQFSRTVQSVKPGQPETLPLAWPDTARRIETRDPNNKILRATSCRTCVNLIPSDQLTEQYGLTAGMCAARGEIIASNSMTRVANSCDYAAARVAGSPDVPSVDGIKLLPEFEAAFKISNSFGAVMVEDPLDYVSDKTLTQDDVAKGIKAWRKVEDAAKKRSIMVPIFDPATFDKDELVRVPRPGDPERPELYRDHDGLAYQVFVMWMKLEQTPAIWGKPGTGKTELLRYLAYLMQIPFVRINITGSTELDSLVGKMTYDPAQGTVFQYGSLPNRWVRPGVLCIDEPNVGPPDVWQVLRPLTDNSKQLVVAENKGEQISRHEGCYLGLAMNPAWDPLNVGTHEIGAADVSRIMHLFVDTLSEDLERQIISERATSFGCKLSKAEVELIIRIGKDVRKICDQGVIPMSWGMREQIKVALSWQFFDPHTVYKLCAGNFLDPQGQDALMSVVSAHVS